jgi:hypothetical protein
MTFKYGLTISAPGANKLRRFKHWSQAALPSLEYRLPPQTPIESATLTMRLRSLEDRQRVLEALAGNALP